MGETVDTIKETLGLKLPPEPEIQPGNEWYNTLPRQVDEKGIVWYQFPNAPNKWIPEPIAKIWYYNAQIQVLQGKLSIVEAKIKKYADEIIRIDEYLAQQEMQETQDEIREAGIRDRIERLQERLMSLKGEGILETDITYRQTQYQIDQLRAQLSPQTPSSQDTRHITSWPTEPGGPSLPGQDLYVIRGAHRLTIRRIQQTEKDPIKDAISANQAYRDYWQRIDEKIRKPKK